LRIAICEDDPTILSKLREHIEDWAEARGTKVDILPYPSAEAFLMAWPELSFDLAFLAHLSLENPLENFFCH